MSRSVRAPFSYARITIQKTLQIMKRGHLAALFILLAISAMVFVGKSPSLAGSMSRKSPGTFRSAAADLGAKLFKPERKLFTPGATEDPQTLTTDKASYLPGETITFTGANWTPGKPSRGLTSPVTSPSGPSAPP